MTTKITLDPTVKRTAENKFVAHECDVEWFSATTGRVNNFSREVNRGFVFDPFTYEVDFSARTKMRDIMGAAVIASSTCWYMQHVCPDPVPTIGTVFPCWGYHFTLPGMEPKSWYLTEGHDVIWTMSRGGKFPLQMKAAIAVLKARGVHIFPEVSEDEAMNALFGNL